MTVVAVELFHSRKRGGNTFEWIARKIEIKRMLQRGISLVRGKDLNVAPGETDEVRFELSGSIADCPDSLAVRKEGEIENTLPYIRLAPMNKVSEIRHTDGIDLLAREKEVKDRIHSLKVVKSESHKVGSQGHDDFRTL